MRSHARVGKALAKLAFAVCLISRISAAQVGPVGSDSTASQQPINTAASSSQQPPSDTQQKSTQKKKSSRAGSFVLAPLPISSPALGSGIVPVVGYIFTLSPNDSLSSPSVIGAAGLATNNGTRAFVIGGDFYLKHDTYEIKSGFAKGNLNYDIYKDSNRAFKLPLEQTGKAFFAAVSRQVGWKFFVGLRGFSGTSLITLRQNGTTTVPIPADLGLSTALSSVGLQVFRDTTPNRFYPTTGMHFLFTADFFAHGLGSKYSFQTYNTTFSEYWSLSNAQVLAYNAYFCATGGSPPFYGNCIYGAFNELRGYTAGQYFTQYSMATQAEYRLVLPKRFGLVAFGGLGGVIPGPNQLFGAQRFLPGVGGGLRFELSKSHHVNLRADIAQGRDGHTFGLGIGEAF